MNKLKIFAVFIGITSAIYVLMWDGDTRDFVGDGTRYVHAEVYLNSILNGKIGEIRILKEIRSDSEKIGDKYFLTVYEKVLVADIQATAVSVVVYEKGKWGLWSFMLIIDEKSEQYVAYGKFI